MSVFQIASSSPFAQMAPFVRESEVSKPFPLKPAAEKKEGAENTVICFLFRCCPEKRRKGEADNAESQFRLSREMVRYASNSFTLSFCAGGTYGKSAHFVMRDPGRKREEERENFLFPSSAATETIGELSERKTFLSLVKGSLYFPRSSLALLHSMALLLFEEALSDAYCCWTIDRDSFVETRKHKGQNGCHFHFFHSRELLLVEYTL